MAFFEIVNHPISSLSDTTPRKPKILFPEDRLTNSKRLRGKALRDSFTVISVPGDRPLFQRILPAALDSSTPDYEQVQLALTLDTHLSLTEAIGVKSLVPLKGALARYRENPLPYMVEQVSSRSGRSLFTPAKFSDECLLIYVEQMAALAFSTQASAKIAPQSPRIAPYLLGGMPLTTLEGLCHRVCDLLFIDTGVVEPTLADSLCCVGFGRHAPHLHHDAVNAKDLNRLEYEEETAYLQRRKAIKAPLDKKLGTTTLSLSQAWLMSVCPRNLSFAEYMLRGTGAYDDSLRRRVTKVKVQACADTVDLFRGPQGMTEHAWSKIHTGITDYSFNRAVEVDNKVFNRAVERVFMQPWEDLEFSCTGGALADDVEVMLARQLIRRLAGAARAGQTPPLMSAVVLLGISLLTGVPLGNWVQFALEDLQRRGETFITDQTVEEVIEMMQVTEAGMVAGDCISELRDLAVQMRNSSTIRGARIAERLRKGTQPFWSMSNGREGYYTTGFARDDGMMIPVNKYKDDQRLERE